MQLAVYVGDLYSDNVTMEDTGYPERQVDGETCVIDITDAQLVISVT